jgi:anaphase-promoting complex subunit 6
MDLLSLDRVSSSWQPTVVNLGHAYRKLEQYDRAVAAYQQALGLMPYDAGTFSALGFTYHLMGQLTKAIETYQKALGFRADCTLTQGLLKEALAEHCQFCSQHDDPGLM